MGCHGLSHGRAELCSDVDQEGNSEANDVLAASEMLPFVVNIAHRFSLCFVFIAGIAYCGYLPITYSYSAGLREAM